jgi:predicted ATP-dependent serine protease
MLVSTQSSTIEPSGSSGGSSANHSHARAFGGGSPVTVQLQAMVRFRADKKERPCFCIHNVPPNRAKQLFKCVLALCQMQGIGEEMLRVDVLRPESGRYHDDFGLALAVAMVASITRKQIGEQLLLVGDVDLAGNIQPASTEHVDCLNKAISAFEVETPVTVVCAPESATWINSSSTVRVIPVRTLAEAVEAVWPGVDLQPR